MILAASIPSIVALEGGAIRPCHSALYTLTRIAILASMWITIGQVAHLIGRSTGTVINWERRGLIPACRRPNPDGYRLWDYDEIMQWMKNSDHPRVLAPPAVEHASESAPQSGN